MQGKLGKSLVILPAVFIMSLIANTCFGRDYIEDKKAVETGYHLVETFYTCISSEKVTDICNDILEIAPHKETEVKSIWDYLRHNKQLFIAKTNTVKDIDFFKWSRKTITYFNPHDLDNITDAQLYISVVHTLPGRNNSGVFKEIAFPIGKKDNSGKYKILFGNIKVNGILLNYENGLVRNFEIIKTLGFENSSGAISQKKKK